MCQSDMAYFARTKIHITIFGALGHHVHFMSTHVCQLVTHYCQLDDVRYKQVSDVPQNLHQTPLFCFNFCMFNMIRNEINYVINIVYHSVLIIAFSIIDWPLSY